MENQSVHVWGHGTPRTLRVYWTLHEVDLAFVSHRVRTRTTDMDSPEFLHVSPGRKIPVIEHGDLLLAESGAITDYLFAYADPSRPTLAEAARIEQWSCFSLMELDATALYVLRRHRGLPAIYGEAPAAVTAAEDYFRRQVSVVDAELADGREFIAGGRLTKADIFLVTCCEWALLEGLELPTAVEDYRGRMVTRPAYRAAFDVNTDTV